VGGCDAKKGSKAGCHQGGVYQSDAGGPPAKRVPRKKAIDRKTRGGANTDRRQLKGSLYRACRRGIWEKEEHVLPLLSPSCKKAPSGGPAETPGKGTVGGASVNAQLPANLHGDAGGTRLLSGSCSNYAKSRSKKCARGVLRPKKNLLGENRNQKEPVPCLCGKAKIPNTPVAKLIEPDAEFKGAPLTIITQQTKEIPSANRTGGKLKEECTGGCVRETAVDRSPLILKDKSSPEKKGSRNGARRGSKPAMERAHQRGLAAEKVNTARGRT